MITCYLPGRNMSLKPVTSMKRRTPIWSTPQVSPNRLANPNNQIISLRKISQNISTQHSLDKNNQSVEEVNRISVAPRLSLSGQSSNQRIQVVTSPSGSSPKQSPHDLSLNSITLLKQQSSQSSSAGSQSTMSSQLSAYKKVLVLDLDETLIHASQNYIVGFDFSFEIRLDAAQIKNLKGISAKLNNSESITLKYYVKMRPHVHEFLEKMAKQFELMIWTASLKEYADSIIDKLDPQRVLISRRLYRESCTQSPNSSSLKDSALIKDLDQLRRNLKDLIIIDNLASCFRKHPQNGVQIKEFKGSKDDNELVLLESFLMFLSQVYDVRDVKTWRNEFDSGKKFIFIDMRRNEREFIPKALQNPGVRDDYGVNDQQSQRTGVHQQQQGQQQIHMDYYGQRDDSPGFLGRAHSAQSVLQPSKKQEAQEESWKIQRDSMGFFTFTNKFCTQDTRIAQEETEQISQNHHHVLKDSNQSNQSNNSPLHQCSFTPMRLSSKEVENLPRETYQSQSKINKNVPQIKRNPGIFNARNSNQSPYQQRQELSQPSSQTKETIILIPQNHPPTDRNPSYAQEQMKSIQQPSGLQQGRIMIPVYQNQKHLINSPTNAAAVASQYPQRSLSSNNNHPYSVAERDPLNNNIYHNNQPIISNNTSLQEFNENYNVNRINNGNMNNSSNNNRVSSALQVQMQQSQQQQYKKPIISLNNLIENPYQNLSYQPRSTNSKNNKNNNNNNTNPQQLQAILQSNISSPIAIKDRYTNAIIPNNYLMNSPPLNNLESLEISPSSICFMPGQLAGMLSTPKQELIKQNVKVNAPQSSDSYSQQGSTAAATRTTKEGSGRIFIPLQQVTCFQEAIQKPRTLSVEQPYYKPASQGTNKNNNNSSMGIFHLIN